MIKDKNQEERERLHKQIIQLENQEEDLLVLKSRYEEKVMDFRTDIWTMNAQIENLIDPVSKQTRKVRQKLDENREKLTKERNSLPWE